VFAVGGHDVPCDAATRRARNRYGDLTGRGVRAPADDEEGCMAVLMREAIGGSLRRVRTARRRTLREVSRRARVSLGYLSEVERGRKEPSSELLAAICEALDIALSDLLAEAAEAIAAAAVAAEAARLRRPVGLRHMDLRIATSDDGPLHSPSPVAPVAPVAPRPAAPMPASPQPVALASIGPVGVAA
jgi:XRE family transcriptional regulator, stress-response regulator